jgi:serine/threonine protein kinase
VPLDPTWADAGWRTVGTHLVQPGAVLADRYVIEDLLSQEAGSESWRARDRVLARSVVLQLLPSTSPRATSMLAAAKRASRVADSRILQVLDAADDGNLSYIVREWATGQSLDVVLSEGPLPARRATWLLREVAGAMVNAHRMGLPHRRLVPDCVVLTKSSGVKLIGLGTAAVLRGESASDSEAELQDTLDLGRLLYACLTARWPGGEWAGLPAAPTEHGRLLRPRQVRAGVPRALDAICDRILSEQSRYGEPITTVADVKDCLTKILAEEGFVATNGANSSVTATPSAQPLAASPAPALLTRESDIQSTGEHAAYTPPSSTPRSLNRTLIWIVALVLVLGIALLAYLVRQDGGNHPVSSASGPTASASTGPSGSLTDGASGAPIPIAAVNDFDPVQDRGNGTENPNLAPLAIDGDPATSWETLEYYGNARFGLLKPGVGLIVDLGRVRDVGAVKVGLGGNGTSVELRAAPASATTAPTDSSAAYTLLRTDTSAGSEADFALKSPVHTRYLLVWLTSLPHVAGDTYQGKISEIRVFG